MDAERLYVCSGSSVLAVDLSSHQVLWRFKTGAQIDSPVALSNRVVYAGSTDGRIYALDASTGKSLWEISAGGSALSPPAVSGGTLYAGSHDGNLYAIK